MVFVSVAFLNGQVEVVVLEVGFGGRYDQTNVAK